MMTVYVALDRGRMTRHSRNSQGEARASEEGQAMAFSLLE